MCIGAAATAAAAAAGVLIGRVDGPGLVWGQGGEGAKGSKSVGKKPEMA
jgi:hypothetical protein